MELAGVEFVSFMSSPWRKPRPKQTESGIRLRWESKLTARKTVLQWKWGSMGDATGSLSQATGPRAYT